MRNWQNSTTVSFTNDMCRISVLDVVEGTSVDGVGLRTSIYVAGCENRCEGCHNPQSWDMRNGTMRTVDELFDLIREADMNVTFSGGDPMLQAEPLTALAARIKTETDKTIWCYTGYFFESLMMQPVSRKFLSYIDVLVDSPFILAQRDISLRFRGSRNQRIIDVPRSLREMRAVELEL